MKSIELKDGSQILYWQKKLSVYAKEHGMLEPSFLPRVRKVDGEDKVLLEAKYESIKKNGEQLTETEQFWCNKHVTGDDLEKLDNMGEVRDGYLHLGIYVDKTVPKEDVAIIKAWETPREFQEHFTDLSEGARTILLNDMSKGGDLSWKIDTFSDGANVWSPSGDRFEFKAK